MNAKAVKQVVAEAIMGWLERDQLVQLGSVKELEDMTGVWLWGKWALKGEASNQAIKRQLKFKTSRSEMTAWEALPDISDDEGMRIDAAVSALADTEREIIRRSYMFWESTHDIPKAMRMTRHQVMHLRDMALSYIAGKLTSQEKAQ